MRIFGKRIWSGGTSQSGPGVSEPASRLPAMPVIVPLSVFGESEYRSYDIVQAIVDYVNQMLGTGLYLRNEIPQVALQAYHADFYLSQVKNGGHSQFIHNSGDNAKYIFGDALTGLTAMGAHLQARLLQEMMDWVGANALAASQQTGFTGGRAPQLDALDNRFYEAEKIDPISPRAAEWISNWPNLRKLDDHSAASEIRALALANPKRARRLSATRIARFHHTATDGLYVGVALAAGMANPPEALLNIRGGYHTEVDGVKQQAWVVDTDGGTRFAVLDDKGARIYEYVEGGGATLETYKPATSGDLLGTAGTSSINSLISYATRFPVAAAGDLLLRRARPAVEHAVLSPQGAAGNAPKPVFWLVAGDESFALMETPAGFFLGGQAPGEKYGPLSMQEAARHAEAAREH